MTASQLSQKNTKERKNRRKCNGYLFNEHFSIRVLFTMHMIQVRKRAQMVNQVAEWGFELRASNLKLQDGGFLGRAMENVVLGRRQKNRREVLWLYAHCLLLGLWSQNQIGGARPVPPSVGATLWEHAIKQLTLIHCLETSSCVLASTLATCKSNYLLPLTSSPAPISGMKGGQALSLSTQSAVCSLAASLQFSTFCIQLDDTNRESWTPLQNV